MNNLLLAFAVVVAFFICFGVAVKVDVTECRNNGGTPVRGMVWVECIGGNNE